MSMQNRKPYTRQLMVCLGAATLVTAAAVSYQPATGAPNAGSQLEYATDGATMTFEARPAGTVAMRLTVSNPAGDIMLDRRVDGASLEWVPPEVLADGVYRWEVTAIVVRENARPRVPASSTAESSAAVGDTVAKELDTRDFANRDESAPEFIERRFDEADKRAIVRSGAFRVLNNEIVPLQEVATTAPEPSWMQRALATFGDLLIPSAAAQCASPCEVSSTSTDAQVTLIPDSAGTPLDWEIEANDSSGELRFGADGTLQEPFKLNRSAPEDSLNIEASGQVGLGTSTPSADLHISDGTPTLRLTDTTDSTDWTVANTNSSRFEIKDGSTYLADCVNSDGVDENCISNPFTIETPSSSNPALADNALYIDEAGTIGIGTDNPNPFFELHIDSGNNGILLGNSPSATISFNAGSNDLQLGGPLFNPVMSIDSDAPEDSVVIAPDGNAGFGTSSPSAPLHISRADNEAQVLVADTGNSGGSAQTMFSLVNNGHPKFRLQDTSQSDVRWEFRTIGAEGTDEAFILNKIGSGAAEMRLFAGGNAEFSGNVRADGVLLTSSRDAKTDITSVDERAILEKLASLEIKSWRYKTDSTGAYHIGPIAEEFQKVFGLSDGKSINIIDTNGIAFSAIKAIHSENQQLRDRLVKLEQSLREH